MAIAVAIGALAAGCGNTGPLEEPLGTALSGAAAANCTNLCGLACGAGCYASGATTDFTCSANLNVRATCSRVQGAVLNTCEDRCPAGYFPAATRSSPTCGAFGGIQTECHAVGGAALQTCNDSCPDGYFASAARTNVDACRLAYGAVQTTCTQIAGTPLQTCEDHCPGGYYPTRAQSNVATCDGRYGKIQTTCALPSGTSLRTCGTACPAGYLFQGTQTNVADCATAYAGLQTLCSKTATSTCDQTCPAGSYVSGTTFDASCPGNLRVQCAKVSGASFDTCQDGCPAGYTATRLQSPVPSCGGPFNQTQITCTQVGGASLTSCETECPAGYHLVREGTSPSCGGRYHDNQITCEKTTGARFSTCGEACPDGWYPTRITTAPQCPHSFSRQVDCSLVNGTQLTTCGFDCPAGWFPGASRSNPGCGAVYFNTETDCSKSNPNAPKILGQPQSKSIVEGQSASLSVQAGGQGPLSYQWYVGTSGDKSHPIPNARGASVTVSPTATTAYWVSASNSFGEADSDTATITVTKACVPVAITSPPRSVTIGAGEPATLSVTASGTSPGYQWFIGGTPGSGSAIPNAGQSALTVTPAATTTYWVKVTNACSSANSATATVTVTCQPPQITAQPQGTQITRGQSAQLSVTATGPDLTYQWFIGASGTGSAIGGATLASVTVQPTDTTTYWVRVRNSCGDANSASAQVAVSDGCVPLAITGQPSSATIDPGQSASLSAAATGTAPTWTWYAGSPGDTSHAVGSGAAIAVSPDTTTSYWARAVNACSTADTAAATIFVAPPSCGPDGAACGGDGNHTCQAGVCTCTNCASGACCGATGNSWCDGQPFFDANTGYAGVCRASLGVCSAGDDFDGTNTYHDGDIVACVKMDGAYAWVPRRPSPRCQEVAQVCDFVCSTHFNGGAGFQCDASGAWSQDPPLASCFGGVLPDGWSCQ